MTDAATGPLIVQSDLTVMVEVASDPDAAVRTQLARFAQLETAPEHLHTYRITPLSLFNAAIAGLDPATVDATLTDNARFPVPDSVRREVDELMGRYGRLWLARDSDGLWLASDDSLLLNQVTSHRTVAELAADRLDDHRIRIDERDRGTLKQRLLALGWPVADEAGYTAGAGLQLQTTTDLRAYQVDAVNAWYDNGSNRGGSGVIALPCGAGKTIVGLGAIAATESTALIVCTSLASVAQWRNELLDKTDLSEDDIGQWHGNNKRLAPVTLTTYQTLTWTPRATRRDHVDDAVDTADTAENFDRDADAIDRDNIIYINTGAANNDRSNTGAHTDKDADTNDGDNGDGDGARRHPNLSLVSDEAWGIVIYDEVHLLPAPVFRATARIQATRRLGLTATLVREDGREGDIFSLIGPLRYDGAWSELEQQGWIAPATCTEVRIPLGDESRRRYANADNRSRFRIASSAPEKTAVVKALCQHHADEQVLVIGQYVDQLDGLAKALDAPAVTGRTSAAQRQKRFDQLRSGDLRLLIVSKVANFSIDLPEVSVAIQVSGHYGSRQEEAQRLGRIVRPKQNGATASFYSLVSDDTEEVRFARNRQRFLAEQGYSYSIIDAHEVDG